MSFCFILSTALLCASALGFILAGFAGNFSRRFYACRYRIMLAPLGFLALGSTAHSLSARLLGWYSQLHPTFQVTHPGGFGSPSDVFETVMLVVFGTAGVLSGIMLGAALDRQPSADATDPLANFWERRRSADTPAAVADPGSAKAPKENVVVISVGRKQPGVIPQVRAISENE